jgi:hypothetical protein
MTPEDLRPFTVQLLALAEGFEKSLSEAQIELYCRGLEDLEPKLITFGFEQAVLRCKFSPSVAEIRQLIEGTGEDAEYAWLQLLEAIRDVGPYHPIQCEDLAVAETIRMLYRDWPDACTAIRKAEGPEKAVQRRDFLLAYRIARKRSLVKANGYLKGLPEFWEAHVRPPKLPPVMVIGRVGRPYPLDSRSLELTPPRSEYEANKPENDRAEIARLPRPNGDQTPKFRGASPTRNGH